MQQDEDEIGKTRDIVRFLYKNRHYVLKQHDEVKDEAICYWVAQPKQEIIFKIKDLEMDKNFEFLT